MKKNTRGWRAGGGRGAVVEASAGAAREARAGWRPRRGRHGAGAARWWRGGRSRGEAARRREAGVARRREAARRHGVEGAAEGGDAKVRRGGRGVGSGAVEAEAYVWGMKSIGARWWLLLTVGPFSTGCSEQPVQKGLLYRLFRTTGAKGLFLGRGKNWREKTPLVPVVYDNRY